jgi:hypothetical protein
MRTSPKEAIGSTKRREFLIGSAHTPEDDDRAISSGRCLRSPRSAHTDARGYAPGCSERDVCRCPHARLHPRTALVSLRRHDGQHRGSETRSCRRKRRSVRHATIGQPSTLRSARRPDLPAYNAPESMDWMTETGEPRRLAIS